MSKKVSCPECTWIKKNVLGDYPCALCHGTGKVSERLSAAYFLIKEEGDDFVEDNVIKKMRSALGYKN
jgi:hypothetical protein